MTQRKLEGKVAIVTGAASGIGEATAKVLAQHGAKIVLADLNADAAEKVAVSIRDAGGEATVIATDVAKEQENQAMVEAAIKTYGGLDILHNNAAATDVAGQDDDVTNMDAALWDKTMSVNLAGPMYASKYAIPHMVERGGGVIINTSSMSSLSSEGQRVAYGVSKAGLNALTRHIATRHGKRGIRCVALALSLTLTPATKTVLTPEYLEVIKAMHATPYVASSEDIANVVAFVASDEARFITGATLPIDGGIGSHLPMANMQQG
jgi:NAD(P)-dependent dehydrogenase (short-subunit alcohol dehydrogenase family)